MPTTVDKGPSNQWVKEQQAVSAAIVQLDQDNRLLLSNAGITDIREYWQLVEVSKFLNNTGAYGHTPQGLSDHLKRDASSVAELLGSLHSKGLIEYIENGAKFKITREGDTLLRNYAIVWP